MYIERLVFSFCNWLNSDRFPKEIENDDVEELVLAWADMTETDLGDNFDALCDKLIELKIC